MRVFCLGVLLFFELGAVASGRLAAQERAAQGRGEWKLEVRQQEPDLPLVSRVQILSASGQPQRIRGALFQQGWNLLDQPRTYLGRVGDYTFQVFHGPEFAPASGGFTLDLQSTAHDLIRLPRHADLALEGWLGGDLLSQLAVEATRPWMPAESLAVAVAPQQIVLQANPAATSPAAASPSQAAAPASLPPPAAAGSVPEPLQAAAAAWSYSGSSWDARPGSGLVLHHWWPPAAVPEHLPSSRLLVLAKSAQRGSDLLPVHAELQRVWARDVPIWLASGRIDSVQLLGPHVTIDGLRAEAVQPLVEPEPGRFRGPHRSGRLVEWLYWQMLECGLRLPPTAGSGFGSCNSPLGYNRVYAYAPQPTLPAWWQAVRDGQSFVTNGPLLRATVNGHVPGAVLAAEQGQTLQLDVALTLTVADPVEYLEVVFNGQALYRARLDEYARAGGAIPPLTVSSSGWLVVRVVTDREHTFRMATTAPYYVEIGGQRRVSRQAVAYFQAWLERAAEELAASSAETRQAAEPYVAAARQFWQTLADQATDP